MKRLLLCLMLLSSAMKAQQINPTVIFQRDTIILQNTNVYYSPVDTPALTDTREELCCIASELRDPDGKTDYFTYAPKTNGSYLASLYGDTAIWMRLFQAARKSDGTKTDIIAGAYVTNDTVHTNGHHGEVIISKNEDVDFRASGGIRLKSGFHVMPGAFFHAYTEPNWQDGDTTHPGDSGNAFLFCDQFNHSGFGQWATMDSINDNGSCFKLSNLQSNVSAYGASDGKTLSITLQKDTCSCGDGDYKVLPTSTICQGSIPGCVYFDKLDPLDSCHQEKIRTNPLSTGEVLSCPWPFKSADTPWVAVSQRLPYGKYEIRDSLPRGMYHSNTYSSDGWEDWNLGEMEYSDSTKILPGLSHDVWYGPFKGKFGLKPGTSSIALRSKEANFSLSNFPIRVIIDGFPYAVGDLYYEGTSHDDTLITFNNNTFYKGGIPNALLNAESVTFYYERSETNLSDSLPWSFDSTGRYFTGSYRIDSQFCKWYQPVSITPFPFLLADSSYSCHWDHVTGKVLLDRAIPSWAPHSGNSKFKYVRLEGAAYPQPKVQMATNQWHTWTMELFPHECRFLRDGQVVQRVPDRLIPHSDARSDFVSYFPRMLTFFHIAMEHNDKTDLDFQGRSISNVSRVIDYVKVWDLPAEYSISKFPY